MRLSPTKSRSSRPFSTDAFSSRFTNGVCRTMPLTRDFIRECIPTCTFSSAVIVRNSLMFWNVRAMPALVTRSGRLAVMSLPLNRTLPVVGLYRPVMQLKKVVLPAPLGPISETMPFSGTLKSTSLTATRPPKTFETFVASRTVSLMAYLVELGRHGPALRVLGVDLGLVELKFASGGWQEALGPQHHHHEQEEAEDPEVDRRDVEVQPERVGDAVELGQAEAVHHRKHDRAEDDAPDVAHPADDDHAQDEHRQA